MEKIKKIIIENKLIEPGQVIGVGVSGGKDSMALLNYLKSIEYDLDFELVAIHVDHGIREESGDDANFVMDFCKQKGIRAYKFKVDPKKLMVANSMSLEDACREARYGVFDAVIKKGIVDKIALAHHKEDQAETVLLRIFRGSGVSGAKGMQLSRDDVYIRPMLETSLAEIKKYLSDNAIEYVEDRTNSDTDFNRNYIRNILMPKIEERWPNAVDKICNFAKFCGEDDAYINSMIQEDIVIYGERSARIPLCYFYYPVSVVNRLLLKVLKKLGAMKDIEKKHLAMIIELAKSENGKKISLPFDMVCIKEYEYISVINNLEQKPTAVYQFKVGEFDAQNFGKVITKRTDPKIIPTDALIVDNKKIPRGAFWRYRKDGDVITKFGGGTVKLKKFFIEKKIPVRMRDFIPVLALDNEIYVVAGVGISAKVKVDDDSKTAYLIKVKK